MALYLFGMDRRKKLSNQNNFIEDVDFIEESIRQDEGIAIAAVNQWLSNGKCNLFLVQHSN